LFSRLRLEFLYSFLSKFDNELYAKNMILHAKAIVLYEKGDYQKALEILNDKAAYNKILNINQNLK
jgi:hypothetical protein